MARHPSRQQQRLWLVVVTTLLGIFAIHPPESVAQSQPLGEAEVDDRQELQQLDEFLNSPSTEQSVPTDRQPVSPPPVSPPSTSPSAIPPPSTIAPPSTAVPPTIAPPPTLTTPNTPASAPGQDSPQLQLLTLNSHNPGTLGNPIQLDDGFYQDRYQFDGQEGLLILLNLIGSDDPRMQLDPRLLLFGPDGSIVAEDDNSGYDAARGDARIVLALPQTGTYTIVVTTAQPDDRGRYTLGLLEVDDLDDIQ